MADDIRYHGFNDNFPSLATVTLALAARLFDLPFARDAARRNLQHLTALFTRRTWLSEFNSPTYTPISLAAMAEVAQFADDEEVRLLALHAEHRMWKDIAAHWHGPTQQPAGPFSRAYESDRVAQFTSLHIPVWLVSGQRCRLHPLNSLFPPPEAQVIHHENDLRFVQGFSAATGAAPYHPPSGLFKRFWGKRLPVTISGDSEAGTYGAVVVAGRPRIVYGCTANFTTTWLDAEFSLGTSRRPFLDGNQSCAFYATWRRRPRVAKLADMRSCFAGYAVDLFAPGQRNRTVLFPDGLARDQIYDHGRCVTLQYQACALVLYRPKLELAGLPVRRLALQVSVPLHTGPAPRIQMGAEELTGGTGQSQLPVPVIVREGRTVLHFRPLLSAASNSCRAITRVEIHNRYLVISWSNFETEAPQSYTEQQLATCSNGFVCEIRDLPCNASLLPLLQELDASQVLDELSADRRSVTYARAGLNLNLAWCPATETIQFATINGENVPA